MGRIIVLTASAYNKDLMGVKKNVFRTVPACGIESTKKIKNISKRESVRQYFRHFRPRWGGSYSPYLR